MKLFYYRNLDGVRAIAALMVMFFHFFGTIKINSSFFTGLIRLSIFGQTGVVLFFVLSGFLITRILISTKDNIGYFKNFYIRRILRIFPLYYLYLVIYYYVIPLIFNSGFIPLREQIFYLAYIQNFAITFHWHTNGPLHFWSLAVEEHFYLFWPLVVYLLSNKNLLRLIYVIIIASLLLRIIMLINHYDVFYLTFTRFDSLAIGALLSLMELRQVFNKLNSKKFLILTLAILFPSVILWTLYTGDSNIIIQVIKYVLLSFTYFAMIGYVLSIKENHFVNKFLEFKFLTYSGKISYGLYVFHPLAFWLLGKFLQTKSLMINLTIGFSMTYLLAACSFHFYESNFLKLKRYFE